MRARGGVGLNSIDASSFVIIITKSNHPRRCNLYKIEAPAFSYIFVPFENPSLNMVLFILCTLAIVVSILAAPVDVVKRKSQLPIAAHSDGQTVLLNEIAYYIPSKPEASYPNLRQIWRLTNTGFL